MVTWHVHMRGAETDLQQHAALGWQQACTRVHQLWGRHVPVNTVMGVWVLRVHGGSGRVCCR